MAKNHHPLRWAIWALAATFYLYEYFLRVFPSVIIPDLMRAFSVNATAVGALSAFYFYIYAPFQLPVGMITDRFGARRLLALAAFTAGVGTFFFGIADSYWTAAAGRFMMGAGSSFGFVGLIYVCSHWFAEKQRGILIGLGNTVGMIGAILGQGPLEIGIERIGWRACLTIMAIFALVLAGLIFLVVRNDPPEVAKAQKKKPIHMGTLWKNLHIVAKNGQSWLNAIISLFFYMTTATFAGLWGIPFVHTKFNVSVETAGFAVSMVFFGWAIGGPLLGAFSDRISQKKSIISLTNFLGFILMSVVVFMPTLSENILFVLFFLVGFISAGQLLTFSYCIDINPRLAKGTAIAFTNFIVVVGAVILQPFVGYLLDLNWTGELLDKARIYSLKDYTIAMSCFPASFLIAFFLSFFLKKGKAV